VATIGPTASSTVTFLAPAFGIAWGAIVLHEPLGLSLIVGAVLILLGIALIVGVRLPARIRLDVETLWTTVRRTPGNAEVGG
jgi:drug/metabolite transporter (DMT)-like permease